MNRLQIIFLWVTFIEMRCKIPFDRNGNFLTHHKFFFLLELPKIQWNQLPLFHCWNLQLLLFIFHNFFCFSNEAIWKRNGRYRWAVWMGGMRLVQNHRQHNLKFKSWTLFVFVSLIEYTIQLVREINLC